MEHPACALCDQTRETEGRDIVNCNHCGQRVSLDSSRSTRGGSDVPNLKTYLLNKKGTLPMSDNKGVRHAVGIKFKAVFWKGKENKRHEIEKLAS